MWIPVLCSLKNSTAIAFLAVSACSVAVADGLIPATYMSGLPDGATLTGVATDSNGNILVAGTVTVAAKDTAAFVAKFAPNGGPRLYYTVLRGNSLDIAGPIAGDAAGNAYISGGTNSPDFPATPGAYQSAAEVGAGVGFVAKLNAQ